MQKSILRAILFSIFMIVLGESLGLFFHVIGVRWVFEVAAENVATGLLSGGLAFLYMEERRRRTEQRVEELAFLNHHIRNALAAIMLAPYAESDTQRLEIIRDASQRIERTIRKMSEQDHVSIEGTDLAK